MSSVPCSQSTSGCLTLRKKVWSLKVLIGTYVYVNKSAIISITKLPSLHPLDIRFSFLIHTVYKLQVFRKLRTWAQAQELEATKKRQSYESWKLFPVKKVLQLPLYKTFFLAIRLDLEGNIFAIFVKMLNLRMENVVFV